MNKVVRNGLVAVLYSPGYGAGWYSWNMDRPELLFHPTLVEMVEQGRQQELTEGFVKELLNLPEKDYVCVLGASDLKIEWVPQGDRFEINEYDGSEYVRIFGPDDGLVA